MTISRKKKQKTLELYRLYPPIESNLPLKLACHKDCTLPLRSVCKRWFFYYHTKKESYLKKVLEQGSMRHDLQGNEVGPVTDEERQHSTEKIEKVRAYWKSKKNEPEPPKPAPKAKKPKPKPEPKRFALPEKKGKKAPTVIIKKRRRRYENKTGDKVHN